MKTAIRITAAASLAAMALSLSSCTGNAKKADEQFIGAAADFSIELFQKSETKNENSLVSPLSVMSALTMTANGAAGKTLSQMEKVLGRGIPLSSLNEQEKAYRDGLPNTDKSKLKTADSIWYRSGFQVKPEFLKKNTDYFNASVNRSAFDGKTVSDINSWVKENTDGMIDSIVEDIPDDTMMYLIDAVTFDAEWQTIYSKNEISQNDFTATDGTKQTVDFMNSEESSYLDDGMATGFIKPYHNNKYSFAALLPNKNVEIETYIQHLSGEKFRKTLSSAETATVNVKLPKFSYDYSVKMNDALTAMGMKDAFSKSGGDFSGMAENTDGNLYISEVLHKTFIAVDERGTKAGAATSVAIADTTAPREVKTVTLDRPFVYAIVDNATDLPVFIGTVMSLQ